MAEIVMTDLDYLERAESLLKAVEAGCDRINDQTDADIDNQRSGGMVTLTFRSRAQIVINLQKPLQEVWMATPAGGYHYTWNGQTWTDTRSGAEFYAHLASEASALAGMPLRFH